VSSIVEREEAQAILEAVRSRSGEPGAGSVETRDFGQPRRLSRERLQRLSRLITTRLPEVCSELAGPLRVQPKLTLASVSEVNADGLFTDLEAPFLVHCFDCGGSPAWILWDAVTAASWVETVLTGPQADEPSEDEEETEQQTRQLSRSECRVLERLLESVLIPITAALGLERTGGQLAQIPEELVTLEDAGPGGDPRRLMLHFMIEGQTGSSDMRIYLPGLDEEPIDAARKSEPTQLPDHLSDVELILAAHLASVEVPLTELLDLEPGDLIPLGVPVGTPVEIQVEDRTCATATWGRRSGLLAIKIEELLTNPLGGAHTTS